MKPITYYWQSINFVSLLLSPVSFIYCLLVSLRRNCYKYGIFRVNGFKIPVIVAGNIYIGGNGKTPLVIWLAEKLKAAGFKPGIVSRGYGATKTDRGPVFVSDDKPVHYYGDEPSLIKSRTRCPVVIDANRSNAVLALQKQTDCNVIISDDGLQHYAMSRLIEINVTDAKRLYGNKMCLPAGPLRERISRLKQVDFIVYNQSGGAPIASSDKHFVMHYEIADCYSLNNKKRVAADSFYNQTVHAVAGIGDPERFFGLLKTLGITTIDHAFEDHHQFQAEDIKFNDQHPVIMTEKDAVKCQQFELDNCWYLPINANIEQLLADKIITKLRDYYG